MNEHKPIVIVDDQPSYQFKNTTTRDLLMHGRHFQIMSPSPILHQYMLYPNPNDEQINQLLSSLNQQQERNN